ncbi:MAG: hypothetical protein ACI8RZ_007262 [Myxococcota bacterium]|jgi:hypothetical protein
MRTVILAMMVAGCDGGLDEAEVKAAVQQHFEQANPPGRTGLLIKGRSGVVWWQASMFEKSCLEQKNLAFNDDPGSRPSNAKATARISPTYVNQWAITAATPTGYCIDLGTDPAVEVGDVVWSADRYRVTATISMKTPTPWFECLESGAKQRVVEVLVENDAPVIETDLSLFQGDCPHPLPTSQARRSSREPVAAAPSAPTAGDIKKLADAFDAALASNGHLAARDMVSCYNLFEDAPYEACAVSEIIAHGSVKAGDADPWLEYAVTDFESFSRPTRDRENPSMYHVSMKHRRSNKLRSFTVQWAEGDWKLVGVVGVKAEGLTTARILNDFHDRDKRDIFARRVAGEKIDEKGEPLPGFEPKD